MARDNRKTPNEYMKIAVEVMKKSIRERKKEDPSPSVGAVLVFPDGTYDTAYRGELREGDHAEYTVLDKKNRGIDLTGCWLFATLEPCAPGARNAPKLSCSERIVNARISDVWFGMEDKNPKVDHGGIDYLEEHGVVVHQFDPEYYKDIESLNREFNEWAKIKNYEAKTKSSGRKNVLEEKPRGSGLDSLSEEALQKFITDSGRKLKPDSTEFLQDLTDMELLEYSEKSGSYIPTGNAILLFGKQPRRKFPQAAVKAKVEYADGTLGNETFDDPLVLIPDKVEEWLKKVLPASIDRSRFKAKQVSHYPTEIIREAVINAIIHRDYSLDGAKVQLEVKPDRIVVKSPGAPPSPVTVASLNDFTATSWSRNKKLSFIFNEMDYMEESGVGMDSFRSIRETFDMPLPLFEFDGTVMTVTFPRLKDVSGKALHLDSLSELSVAEREGYDFVRSRREVSKREYAEHLGVSDKIAQNHLRKMRDLGLISDNGEPPKSNNYRYVYRG